jgi:ABC-type multidrug transport system fused ATPase/permease subunit
MFPDGRLTLVTGPTASGKTALLVSSLYCTLPSADSDDTQLALLGEMMPLPGGRIILPKCTSRIDSDGLMYSLSYAAQSSWLRQQSIKENILFDYPYDETKYRLVVESCALQPDLDIFEDGDATEIGARYDVFALQMDWFSSVQSGVTLSGGQKARYDHSFPIRIG